MSVRTQRLADLVKARDQIDARIWAMTRHTPSPPPSRPTPVGRLVTPNLEPEATWEQIAHANQVFLADLYDKGIRHITHRGWGATGQTAHSNGDRKRARAQVRKVAA